MQTDQVPDVVQNNTVHHTPLPIPEIHCKKRFEKPIVIRLTREEREQLHADANAADTSLNGYVRQKLGFDISNASKRRKRRSDSPAPDRSRTNG